MIDNEDLRLTVGVVEVVVAVAELDSAAVAAEEADAIRGGRTPVRFMCVSHTHIISLILTHEIDRFIIL